MGTRNIPIRDIVVHRTRFAGGPDRKNGRVGGFR
jgi:hypothetical protein